MIRFNCPHCGRYYEVPEALAGLPLVCKQCGQRFTPPAESTAAEPPSPPPPKKSSIAPPPRPSIPPQEDVHVAKSDSTPDIDFNAGGPTAQSRSEVDKSLPAALSGTNPSSPADTDEEPINLDLLPQASPPPPVPWRATPGRSHEAEPEREESPGLLPFVADAVAFVVLVVGGLMLGEVLVRKPTGEVLSGLSSPKFPPIELLIWGAPATLFALVYLLLVKRGIGLGSLVRKIKRSRVKE